MKGRGGDTSGTKSGLDESITRGIEGQFAGVWDRICDVLEIPITRVVRCINVISISGYPLSSPSATKQTKKQRRAK